MHLIGRKKENYNARIHYITAKPFFLHRGYHVMKEQEGHRGGSFDDFYWNVKGKNTFSSDV